MLALISFLAVVVIVVSVHEFGHYLAARHFGVIVLRFSVGFGRPIFKRRDSRGTLWILAPIPLGGYVLMMDKEMAALGDLPVSRSIDGQSHLRRIIIYLAGPAANLVLSFLVMLVILAGGESGVRPHIEEVRASSPAAIAGIRGGDDITAVNGEPVEMWRQAAVKVVDAILADDDIIIETARGGRYHLPAQDLSLDDITKYGGSIKAIGLYPYEGYIKLKVARVEPGSPADGRLRQGDEIVAIDGALMERWRHAAAAIADNPNRPIPFVLWRDGGAVTITVTPAARNERGREKGYLGVTPQIDEADLHRARVRVYHSPLGMLREAFAKTYSDAARGLSFLGILFSGEVKSEYVSGPIGIMVQSGQAAELGFAAWLRFITLLSTSLALLNLLPLPVLDGGHIALSVVQLIARRDFSDKALRAINIFGATVLLCLLIFVVINDFIRFF